MPKVPLMNVFSMTGCEAEEILDYLVILPLELSHTIGLVFAALFACPLMLPS